MKTFKTLALAAAVSAGLLSSAGVMAARQGELGATSDGDFDILYVKGQQVRIWGLKDFVFDNSSAGGLTQSENICVFSNGNNSSNQYKLTVTSDNGDAGDSDEYFKLSDGADVPTTVNYSFVFKDNSGTSVWDTTSKNSAERVIEINAGPLVDQPNPNEECVATNATIDITIPTAPTQTGVYTDGITLLVEPE